MAKTGRNYARQKISVNIGGDVSHSAIRIGDNIGYTPEEVSELIKQISSKFRPKPFDGMCPYKGLDYFEEADAELFFGREKLVDELVRRVEESRTVFITGPSGSGKSSLVRAGLIHALRQGSVKGSDQWLYATIKPGRDPFEALAMAFSRLKSPELGEFFRKNRFKPGILHECAESILSDNKHQRLVIFLDQFEEVFTQVSREEERVIFLNLLTHAATNEDGRVIFLFAMRSDFIPNCATYPNLNDILNRQFVQIGSMQPEELVSAIAQPALRVGLKIDPDLIAQIINDMKGEPGALPLMQFALKDLFDAMQTKGGLIQLTLSDYLDRGGIDKMLARHADESFAEFTGKEQELARSIFRGLIEIGRGTQDTKRTAVLDELVPANASIKEVTNIIQKLADARLVTTEETESNKYTITHEKLIEAWPWLKRLINEDRDAIALQNEIAEDAGEWEKRNRDPSYLYIGGRLANVQDQVEAKELLLNERSNEFIQTGLIKQNRERKLRIIGISGLAGLILAGILTFSYVSTQNANKLAEQSRVFSVTQQAIADEAQASAEKAQQQAKIALSRQLTLSGQVILSDKGLNPQTAILLFIQSMKLSPNADAAVELQENKFARTVTRMIHEDEVYTVAFSPDGRYVATGSMDGTARVWEAQTGTEVARTIHQNWVRIVAFSPDGKYIVSGSKDNTVRVWETKTGIEVARIIHDAKIINAIFSPDGKSVVTSSLDGTVRVWEAQTGTEVVRMTLAGTEVNLIPERVDPVSPLALSPDGKYAATAAGRTVHVWEVETGNEIANMIHEDEVDTVVFSPDGKYIVSGSKDTTARVWDARTGIEVGRTYHHSLSTVALSPDGMYIVLGFGYNTAIVQDFQTGNIVVRMGHAGPVTTIAFSPDGKYIVSGGRDGTARVWNIKTGIEIARVIHTGPVSTLAFSPDGKYVVSGSLDGTVRVWASQTVNEVSRIITDSHKVFLSPDGKFILSLDSDYTLHVWEMETGNEVARLPLDDKYFFSQIGFSPDNKYIVATNYELTHLFELMIGSETANIVYRKTYGYGSFEFAFSPNSKYIVSASNDGTARVWETQTGIEIIGIMLNDSIRALAFSPDSNVIVSAGDSGIARVWVTLTGEEIARMSYDGALYYPEEIPNDFIDKYVAFSPDGKYLALGALGTVHVWKVESGNEIARMNHNGGITAVTFSPDGRYIVSGSADGTARVWEVEKGTEVARISHAYEVWAVAFSPDGKFVASGSVDGTVRVWEALNGNEVTRMNHTGEIFVVTFSPDGKYVLTGTGAGTIHMWLWQSNDLTEDACSRVARNLTFEEWKQYISDALPYQAICDNLPIDTEP